jgi:capsular polysaccharide biosynthesis protein
MPLPPFSPDIVGSPPTKPHEAGLDDVFVYLRRNISSILAGLAGGLLLGILVQLFTRPVYEVDAKFTINQLPFDLEKGTIDAETQRQIVQTLILSLSSEKAVSLYSSETRANVRVSSIRNTRMGLIRVQSQSPEFAVSVANAVLGEGEILNVIGSQLLEYQRIQEMQKDQFDVLNRQYADLQIEAAKIREQIDLLKQYVEEEKPLEYFPSFEADPTLNNLKTQLMLVQSEYDRIATQSTRGPRLQGKAAEVDGLKSQIAGHSKKLETSLRSRGESLEIRCQQMVRDLEEMRKNMDQADRKGAKILDALANPTGSQVKTSSEMSKEISSNVLVVLDYAHADHRPVRPILWLNLIAGGVLGMSVGLLLPILISASKTRLKTGHQIREQLGIEFLGYLPTELSTKNLDMSSELYEHPGYSTELGVLRASIIHVRKEHEAPYIFAFVASGLKNTAHFMTADLGVLLAESEKKVLIIDLDFSQPRLSDVLGIPVAENEGLYGWLRGEKSLKDCVAFSVVRELALLAPGKDLRSLQSLIARRPLDDALLTEGKAWDYILINSPDLIGRNELPLVLPSGRKVILVAEYGKTTIGDSKKTIHIAHQNEWMIHGMLLRNAPARYTKRGGGNEA